MARRRGREGPGSGRDRSRCSESPESRLGWEGSLKLGIRVPGPPKCSTRCFTVLVITNRIIRLCPA